jgi:hypothetical protein
MEMENWKTIAAQCWAGFGPWAWHCWPSPRPWWHDSLGSSAVSRVMRSCRARPGHFSETVGQGGVARLLVRWRGTGEGEEEDLAVAFDDALVIGGSGDVLQHRGGEGSEVRPREEDEDDRSSELTARTSQWRRVGEWRRHPMVDGSSSVLLQQGEATGEVRGELN